MMTERFRFVFRFLPFRCLAKGGGPLFVCGANRVPPLSKEAFGGASWNVGAAWFWCRAWSPGTG